MSRLNFPFMVALDTNGDVISGAKLAFFESGTSTPLDSYSEETLTTANANPLIADAAGRFSDVFLKSQDYKITLSDASDVLIDTWDPVGPEAVADFFQDIEGSLQSTGSSNAYVVASNQTVTALAAGIRITFIANHANTGAATLALDDLTAKTIKKWHDQDLVSGDIETDQIIDVSYKATEDVWQMLNPAAQVTVEGEGLTLGTPQATTSGTAWEFTPPSWAKRITMMFDGVSFDGIEEPIVQLSDSGGYETSGYNGSTAGDSGSTIINHVTGFLLHTSGAAAITYYGHATFTLMNASAFTWHFSGNMKRGDSAAIGSYGEGTIALDSALTALRLTTTGTPDDGDAGEVNIQYE